MAFNITEFTSNLQFGGARPSLFEVNMTNPINTAADNRFRFSCRVAQIPATTVTPITTQYFGRPIKFAANRTYEDWSVTIINDEDFSVRSTLEEWCEAINGTHSNLSSAFSNTYKSQAEVIHYGKIGDVLRKYTIQGMWPTNIAAIDLDWSNADVIEEYTVTFSLDHWSTDSGFRAPGAAIGSAGSGAGLPAGF